ncbi:hypothetical protein DL237_14710 [Pseudooceanicola sediminis]|uniref:DUF3291 domain-containing protein n=1 Tax=Pseudooceanicola sediminis TaxID=2211117 RepID=A0A399J1Y9_9RHOB|nr:hypothetical protein [Pseudooceanicola sediminis]RII37922.1 hypothetical protein DL237_14710 [Pseudooceanicola sediminis]|tara:strand:+ start:54202 stop:54546 length:345 start_codon:yes stop_codon:yes gene_type:complete
MFIAVIGGLRVRSALRAPEFFFLTMGSLVQARRAEGVLHASVFPATEGFFSLSVWDSPASMKRYAQSGAHKRAMIRSGRVAVVFPFHHFPCTAIPTQQAALQMWREREALKKTP